MNDLLKAWSAINSLSFEGQSTFAETDKSTGKTATAPEPSRFKCWMADLDLNKARWESDAEKKRWYWHPFVEPVRYRVEYAPYVDNSRDDPSLFHSTYITEIGDGKLIMTNRRRDRTGGSVEIYMQGDNAGAFLQQRALGICCLPPLFSIHTSRVFSEAGEPEALSSLPPGLQRYHATSPRLTMEIEVAWDAEKQWFTKVEASRQGVPTDLLDKLRAGGTLSQEERLRLATEREQVEAIRYEVVEFQDAPQAGICFPRKIEKMTWQFDRWAVHPELSDNLFQISVPEGAKVQKRNPRL